MELWWYSCDVCVIVRHVHTVHRDQRRAVDTRQAIGTLVAGTVQLRAVEAVIEHGTILANDGILDGYTACQGRVVVWEVVRPVYC